MLYRKNQVYRRPPAEKPSKAKRPARGGPPGPHPRWARWAMAATAAAVLLSIVIGGMSLARFVLDQHENSSAQAQNFYFSSNQMSEPEPGETVGEQYSLVWWTPGEPLSITINLHNFRDALNVSPEEVTYSLTATDNSAVKLSKMALTPQTGTASESTGGSVSLAGQKLGTGSTPEKPLQATQSYTLTLAAPSANVATYRVQVQAVSSLPYVKTLNAEYTIVVANGSTAVSVTDQKGYLAAKMWLSVKPDVKGAGETTRITLTYPDGVVPDMTNPWLQAADTAFDPTARTLTAAFPTGGTTEIYFFKTNETADFSGNAAFTATLAATS